MDSSFDWHSDWHDCEPSHCTSGLMTCSCVCSVDLKIDYVVYSATEETSTSRVTCSTVDDDNEDGSGSEVRSEDRSGDSDADWSHDLVVDEVISVLNFVIGLGDTCPDYRPED